jgi:hypothetical protein
MGTHVKRTKAERDPTLKPAGKSKKFRDACTKYFIDVTAELTVNNANGSAIPIVLKVR